MIGTLRVMVRGLLVTGMVLLVACTGGSPEAAARKGFEEWVKSHTVAYRNPVFSTITSQDAFATIQIDAEFQLTADAQWLEQRATVQVVKQGSEWRPPTGFQFGPSPRALQTMTVIQNATATVVAAQAQATATVRAEQARATAAAQQVAQQATATSQEANRQGTATAIVMQQQAQATNAAQARLVSTQQAQSAQATRVAEGTQQAIRQATVVAQRSVQVNQPMKLVGLVQQRGEKSVLRQFLNNVEFLLTSVERADTSAIWHFSVRNQNGRGVVFSFSPITYEQAYLLASDGRKTNAQSWRGIERAVPGERREFVIAIGGQSRTGIGYKLSIPALVEAGDEFDHYWYESPIVTFE